MSKENLIIFLLSVAMAIEGAMFKMVCNLREDQAKHGERLARIEATVELQKSLYAKNSARLGLAD